MGIERHQSLSREHQVHQAEQREELRLVLGETAITRFAMLEQVLQDMERVLDLRSDARLEFLDPLHELAHRIVRQRLALAALHGDMPFGGRAMVLLTLLRTLVAGVTEDDGFIAMQQRMGLADIAGVGRRADDRMHQARLGIDTDVRLHAEVPVVTLLRLMHLRIAGLGFVLGRRWCGDEGRIDDSDPDLAEKSGYNRKIASVNSPLVTR